MFGPGIVLDFVGSLKDFFFPIQSSLSLEILRTLLGLPETSDPKSFDLSKEVIGKGC